MEMWRTLSFDFFLSVFGGWPEFVHAAILEKLIKERAFRWPIPLRTRVQGDRIDVSEAVWLSDLNKNTLLYLVMIGMRLTREFGRQTHHRIPFCGFLLVEKLGLIAGDDRGRRTKNQTAEFFMQISRLMPTSCLASARVTYSSLYISAGRLQLTSMVNCFVAFRRLSFVVRFDFNCYLHHFLLGPALRRC